MPASPLPAKRTCWPSRMPAGIWMVTRSRSGTRPWPLHSGQGFSMTVPVPPQSGQVVAVCMSPRKVRCTLVTRPAPWQVEHSTWWPSSVEPVPLQSSQGARRS